MMVREAVQFVSEEIRGIEGADRVGFIVGFSVSLLCGLLLVPAMWIGHGLSCLHRRMCG